MIKLTPMFPEAPSVLARFLPEGTLTHKGLQSGFCHLHDFLRYLYETAWFGHVHVSRGEQQVHVLVFEGRIVSAASNESMGEQVLAELLQLYEIGATMNAYTLTADVTHALTGVNARVWKVPHGSGFTGIQVDLKGSTFIQDGKAFAHMPVVLGETGIFVAPLRPNTMMLPKPLAGWAHQSYPVTLRGRDVLTPITPIHASFRKVYGQSGFDFLGHLKQDMTPAEYALRHDIAVHELEPLVQAWLKEGLVKTIK